MAQAVIVPASWRIYPWVQTLIPASTLLNIPRALLALIRTFNASIPLNNPSFWTYTLPICQSIPVVTVTAYIVLPVASRTWVLAVLTCIVSL